MRVLLTSMALAVTVLAGAAICSRAEAAMMRATGIVPPQTKSHSEAEKVGYYRRHARRAYRRGYYGYGSPYYGYRPYGYYGYGYRPYGYGYGWRPRVGIFIGPGWGWGY